LHPHPDQDGKWPVLIFSHGLGSFRNAYSYLCGTLASYGMVVLAPEHRDGSCPVSHIHATNETPATEVEYKRISHKPSPEVYAARDEMLKIRLWELALVHEALRKIDAGEPIINLLNLTSGKNSKTASTPLFDSFRNNLDIHTPGSISFGGHSFGASTTVQFLKSMYYYKSNPHRSSTTTTAPTDLISFTPSTTLLNQITPITPSILLDLWCLPLNSPNQQINSLPMPFYTVPIPDLSTNSTTPILAILSRSFVNWTANFASVFHHLSPPPPPSQTHTHDNEHTPTHPPALIFYPLSSAHLSQSDFGILFPRLTKYVSKAAEPVRTMKLNTRAILQILRYRGVKVEGEDDAVILSVEKGAVRGWIAAEVDAGGDVVGSEGEGLQEHAEVMKMSGSGMLDAEKAEDGLGDDEMSAAGGVDGFRNGGMGAANGVNGVNGLRSKH